MTDNELLLAISNMMDKKLDSRLKPIENDIKSLKGDVSELKNDVSGLKSDVSELKNDVSVLKSNVSNLNNEVTTLKGELHNVKLFQENVILPRLNTIEACYTSTYDRYKNYAERMEANFDDTELLKKVVEEHSKKLQKIS